MLRRLLITAAGLFAAFMLAMVVAGVFVVVRREEGGVRAARKVVERVATPEAMRLAGEGTDQKTPYRDYLVADDAFDELAGVRPPPGYELDDRLGDGGGPLPFGDWQIVAEWGGPDPRGSDRQDCLVLLQSTKLVRRNSSALSEEEKHTVEGSAETLVRVSAVCQV